MWRRHWIFWGGSDSRSAPFDTPTASQYRTGHTNGTLVRKHRSVRQMAANGFLLPNVIGTLGIANQTPPGHNPPETMTRERTVRMLIQYKLPRLIWNGLRRPCVVVTGRALSVLVSPPHRHRTCSRIFFLVLDPLPEYTPIRVGLGRPGRSASRISSLNSGRSCTRPTRSDDIGMKGYHISPCRSIELQHLVVSILVAWELDKFVWEPFKR